MRGASDDERQNTLGHVRFSHKIRYENCANRASHWSASHHLNLTILSDLITSHGCYYTHKQRIHAYYSAFAYPNSLSSQAASMKDIALQFVKQTYDIMTMTTAVFGDTYPEAATITKPSFVLTQTVFSTPHAVLNRFETRISTLKMWYVEHESTKIHSSLCFYK